MFYRNRFLRSGAAIASLSLAACGCGLLSDGSGDGKGPIVVGTTSAPSTLDPAGAWDGSWELYRNIFQTLLAYPNGATTPQPDAAKSCSFTDSTSRTYRCELRPGLKFADGDALTAGAVKYSIDRIRTIDAPGGPGIRMDSHVYAGYRVPPNYDSMIGKLIAYGPTRESAIARMRTALAEMIAS